MLTIKKYTDSKFQRLVVGKDVYWSRQRVLMPMSIEYEDVNMTTCPTKLDIE